MTRAAKILCYCLLLSGCTQVLRGQENQPYQLPPVNIRDVLATPELPFPLVSSTGDRVILLEYENLLPIAELMTPAIKVAGLTIDPLNNGFGRISLVRKITIRNLRDTGYVVVRGLPADALMSSIRWSPDHSKIGFCLHKKNEIELWYADAATGVAKPVRGVQVNLVFNDPYAWLPNSSKIICRTVPARRPPLQPENAFPAPKILENQGQESKTRTYQNLIRNAYDAYLFEYYSTSQLVVTDLKGRQKNIGNPGITHFTSPSPNGEYVLLKTIHKPYSYQTPYYKFPKKVQVYAISSGVEKTLIDIPPLDKIPPYRDAVSATPRDHDWRPNEEATVYWLEAQDEGNPKKKAAIRDNLYTWAYPFSDPATLVYSSDLRCESVLWGGDSLIIVNEKWWESRKRRITLVSNGPAAQPPRKLFEYSSNDLYNNPGKPYSKANASGKEELVVTQAGQIYLLGQGASRKGMFPFVDLFNVANGEKKRIWQAEAPYYEEAVSVLNGGNSIFTSREAVDEYPNYFIRQPGSNASRQVTFYKYPYEKGKKIIKKTTQFKRSDGVSLYAEFYLPSDHGSAAPLPTLVWSYPTEYLSNDNAGQTPASSYRFIYTPVLPPVALALQGYAVMLTTMPIVGDSVKKPADTFIEQVVLNARAAIREGVSLGIVDSARVALGGHSYGAFMVANLLTHSTYFKAGIAFNGAYNRSLTPFGFQSEERNYWEASDTYDKISPFQQAHRMKTPILLIHGEADENSGTFPLQSERYYHALKGLGGTVRYVSLPYEGHHYRTTESVFHIYSELLGWLDKHLKNKSSISSYGK